MKQMKLKFENQAFQLQAIESTVNLFSDMQILELTEQLANQNEILSYDLVRNGLQLNESKLLSNLQSIQLLNSLENYTTELYYGEYAFKRKNDDGNEIEPLIKIPNVSIEMETGTGK